MGGEGFPVRGLFSLVGMMQLSPKNQGCQQQDQRCGGRGEREGTMPATPPNDGIEPAFAIGVDRFIAHVASNLGGDLQGGAIAIGRCGGGGPANDRGQRSRGLPRSKRFFMPNTATHAIEDVLKFASGVWVPSDDDFVKHHPEREDIGRGR